MQTDGTRGSRFYEDRAVRTRYLAHRHSGASSPNEVMEEPAFLHALGPLDGMCVVDLGCGDGATAASVVGLGAQEYLGIDGSIGMIEAARERTAMSGVRFIRQDIEDLDLGHATFDVVISRMALHHVERLDPVMASIRDGLRPGGRLIITVPHPVITCHDAGGAQPRTNWTVDDYFDRGPRRRLWFESTVVWHHRTVEDYVRLTVEHGFGLEVLSECEPDAGLLAGRPDELVRRRRVPLILLIAASRSAR